MKGLLLRLSAVDAGAEAAVRVIAYFNALAERGATAAELVRATAALAECPAGLDRPGAEPLRFRPDGSPAGEVVVTGSVEIGPDAGRVWLARERRAAPVVLVGVGPPVPGLQARTSWKQAKLALRFATPDDAIIDHAELGSVALLGELPPERLRVQPDVAALDALPATEVVALEAFCRTGSLRKRRRCCTCTTAPWPTGSPTSSASWAGASTSRRGCRASRRRGRSPSSRSRSAGSRSACR